MQVALDRNLRNFDLAEARCSVDCLPALAQRCCRRIEQAMQERPFNKGERICPIY